MDEILKYVYFFTLFSLLMVSSATVHNMTYCVGVEYTGNQPLCPADEVIQVDDVLVYDFHEHGLSELDRSCYYDSRDKEEPLLDVSATQFSRVFEFCDGKSQCSDIYISKVSLSDRSLSNYVVMRYGCTRNHTGGFKSFTSRFSLECPPDLEIQVVAAYYRFTCRSGSFYEHVGTPYFEDIYNECDGESQCHNVLYKTITDWCIIGRVQSDSVAVYYKCAIPATSTTEYTTTSQSTSLSPATDTIYTSGSASTGETDPHTQTEASHQTSPIDGEVTQADQHNQSDGTVQSIGLYIGVCIACIAVIVIIVVTVICVKRKRAPKKESSSVYMNQGYNGQSADQIPSAPMVVADNVYTNGEEYYSQVGPAEHQAVDHREDNASSEVRTHIGARSVVHNKRATLEADYSLATAFDEYSVVNRQRVDPDELEILDNDNYEPSHIGATIKPGTAPLSDHEDVDHTVMVENSEYVPWTDKSDAEAGGDVDSSEYANISGDSRAMDTEQESQDEGDVVVDNAQYTAWKE